MPENTERFLRFRRLLAQIAVIARCKSYTGHGPGGLKHSGIANGNIEKSGCRRREAILDEIGFSRQEIDQLYSEKVLVPDNELHAVNGQERQSA
jgi:hypothetical protein